MREQRKTPTVLTRRAVLVGGVGALALSACSSNGSSAAKDTTPADQPTASLLAFFPLNDYITAGVPQRIAFGVANANGGLSTDTPETLRFTMTGPGKSVETFTVRAHRRNLPWAYYPINFTPKGAGQYEVRTITGGHPITAAFAVGKKGSSDVPGPGDKMPSMHTPTTTDALGVDPVCTQNPPCPLHDVSLDAALGKGRPVAYLVATPKFCQTGVCGPVLDVLETSAKKYAEQITFIHQEVYQSAKDAAEKGTAATLTKAVQQLKLTSEPVLFVTDRTGVIRHRLDAAYDADELTRVFDDVTA